MAHSTSSSFVLDLKKWLSIMDAYHSPSPGHAYHATMPTDTILSFCVAAEEVERIGFEKCRELQVLQGFKVREMLAAKGFKSIAAEPFQAPTVVVHYTTDPAIKSGAKFVKEGLQIAAGVPLMC